MEDLIQLETKHIRHIREEILQEQDGRCAICGEPITESTGISLDHQHKTKAEEIGVDGAGLVRGVLCRSCNVYEGKIWNASKRFGKHNSLDEYIGFIESLLAYYKKPNYNYIHPSEKPKEPKVSKRQYNTLKRTYINSGEVKKFPEYPKNGKLTKPLKALFEAFEISPYL